MKVEVYDDEGNLRVDAVGRPILMHAADALNAEKTGRYKLVREERQFGDIKKNIITQVRMKTEDDYAKDIEMKREALEKQKKSLEADEVALQEKLEEVKEEKVKKEPKPIVEEGKPITEKKTTTRRKASTKK